MICNWERHDLNKYKSTLPVLSLPASFQYPYALFLQQYVLDNLIIPLFIIKANQVFSFWVLFCQLSNLNQEKVAIHQTDSTNQIQVIQSCDEANSIHRKIGRRRFGLIFFRKSALCPCPC